MSNLANDRSRIKLEIQAVDPWSGARAAKFNTKHGLVETPIFMPVATQAALRCVDMSVAASLGYQVLLANTYHLLLRPGLEVFEKFKGIHNFMDWPGTVLTDSGGFQIFSLSRQLKMSEEGARFRSYLDGTEILLTPEKSIAMQRAIGSDIMMVLDHCIDSTSDEATTRAALELTTRWAKRSYAARGDSDQALFGIVQGACYQALRKESAEQICSIPFDGFALGGLAVGETKAEREDVLEYAAPLLPKDKPRYLMGVGTPIDLLEAVKRGMDMFDCILPTSFAHQGVCFTSTGKLDLRRGAFSFSEEPLDSNCACSTCKRFSRGYLHHLVKAKEFVADQHLGIHNLTFYQNLIKQMRQSIIAGNFKDFYHRQREILTRIDDECPIVPPRQNKPNSNSVLGDYEVVPHKDGYGSIKQVSSGEIMHSVSNPEEEALALYVSQAGIPDLVATTGEDLCIWDVGLGAATNAMSCILELEKINLRNRKVNIVSFERDLDPLRLALTEPKYFKHLRHSAPNMLVSSKRWANKAADINWQLIEGDFLETMHQQIRPDIIWYDPFSYKVDSLLWTVTTFKKLLDVCQDREVRLYTYTASTAVRAAMLAAGWYVGPGESTGPKKETTIAYSAKAALKISNDKLLGLAWLERWERSDAKQPFGDDSAQSTKLVRLHRQFT